MIIAVMITLIITDFTVTIIIIITVTITVITLKCGNVKKSHG